MGSLADLNEKNPAELLRILKELDKKSVTPHPGQLPVYQSTARFRIMNCGRRFGKSTLAAKCAVQETREPDQMVWWVAPTYRVVKRGYAEILRQLPEHVLAKKPPPDSHFDSGRQVVLQFKNGSRIEFFSAERPEGMLGAAVDFVVLDEAATMPQRVWAQIIYPTLGDRLGKALLVSTPRGRNWFYMEYLKGQQEEHPDYESWTFRTHDNPTLPPGEADRMAANMPQMIADQEIHAKWLASGSNVFLLDDAVIQQNDILPSGLVDGAKIEGTVFLGVDLARTNDYTVLYGTIESSRENCYLERMQAVAWSEQRHRIRRAVATLRRAGAEHVTLMVDDGNAGTVIIEDLLEAGYDVIGVNFTTHKANMVRLLANDLEAGRAFVLLAFVDEFTNFQMNMTKGGTIQYSAPEGQKDDVVAAKMLSHWGCVNYGVADISIRELIVSENEEDYAIENEDEDEDYSDLDLDEDELMDDLLDQADASGGMTPHERAVRGWF